jgi:hypothetical protein
LLPVAALLNVKVVPTIFVTKVPSGNDALTTL